MPSRTHPRRVRDAAAHLLAEWRGHAHPVPELVTGHEAWRISLGRAGTRNDSSTPHRRIDVAIAAAAGPLPDWQPVRAVQLQPGDLIRLDTPATPQDSWGWITRWTSYGNLRLVDVDIETPHGVASSKSFDFDAIVSVIR